MVKFFNYPLVHGAITGLLAAAAVDYRVFKTWKGLSDLKSYDWNVAVFRWAQGAVVGAVTGAGLGAL